ncbi:CehA/McbA family metallohydrolase [Actinospica durhamensis]|uniref:CehA/McbA family metallohydrolase n=1 Tax=Actinospica durhamensis TaxID=1508375 RepID=A0A941ITM5_9ACTN|nr:CehA/McbA family metallohydrolase [Actinospica durhamensis]MBR7836158.1 CehA/McbA family metallohydrolase [Actinospica durhamensis]
MNWYRGDCHVHSVLSHGGELTPEQLAADARAAGLDFVATTEHNTVAGHAAWAELGASNGDSDTGDGDLLVLFGQEVVTHTGHWLALGLEPGQLIDGGYGVRDEVLDRHLAAVHRVGGLCVAAHPHAPYPSGTFMYPYEGFDVVEVWNGPWTSDVPWQADNEAALAEWGRSLAADVHRGRWRPAIGNSDTHLAGQIGIAHTVVATAELTAATILDGIRTGRSWIAGSAEVWLDFNAAAGPRHAGIGELLDTEGAPAVIRAQVRGVPGGTVTVHTERGLAHRATLPASGSDVVLWQTAAAESGFVRVEVRHADGQMAALSNPITLV